MKRIGYLLLILMALLTPNCDSREVKYQYPNDHNISDENGNPKDSTVQFFPKALTDKDSIIDIDPYNWFSANLHLARERILYNNYLGYDSYRFTWLRSFDEPIFITINKQFDEYWMTIKKLNKPFVQYQEVVKFVPPSVSEADNRARQEENDLMIDTLKLLPKIVIDKRIEIEKENWDNFELQLKDCNYWNLRPSDPKRPGLDGSYWIIEAHFKERYWVVDRWSPKDNFRDCGQYLLRLSGIGEDVY